GYSLSAAATGLSTTTSATFAGTAGAATQLAFAVQPSTTTAGAGLQPAVQVTVQDALGNAVPGFTGQVSVAITAGTGRGGATLSGTKTVAPVAGVATFSNLSIDKSGSVKTGTGYTLSATAAGLTGVTSEPFDITPGAATQLVFSIQPRAAAAGAHIAPPVEVTALDVSGNLVPTFTGTVTVAIGTNQAGGTISGTTTVAAVAAVAGVATFATLNIDNAGSGYRLSATAAGFTGAASAPFDITPATAIQLSFSQQPSTAAAGAAIAPAVQVTALDAAGNTVTGFTGNVTLAIGANPGAGVLSGTTTVGAVGGVAAFPTLRIDRAGVGYTLSATAVGLTGAASPPFDITAAQPNQLVFTVQPTGTAAGASINPAVQVTARDAAGLT